MDISGISSFNTSIAGSMNQYKSEQSKLEGFQESLKRASEENVDDELLKKACVDFEGYFLQMMMKEMRKTINTENSYVPRSNAENMFTEMLDEEIAKQNASIGGIGLADAMFKQLSRAK